MATTWTIAIDWDRDGEFSGDDIVTGRTVWVNWFLGFRERTSASGRPIDSGNKHPDYIVEGREFDAYTVGGPKDIASGQNAIGRIRNALTRKVPSQADRLVIDLSYTDRTADKLTKYLSDVYATGDPHIADLKEVFVMKDYTLSGIWVQPKV